MQKFWHPQKNKKDSSLTVLKSFIHYLELKISRYTIEKEAQAHEEFPKLSISALSSIIQKWGIESVAIKLETAHLSKLPSPSILVMKEEDLAKSKERYQFVMFYELLENEIEYLHPRRGWIVETLEEFKAKWEGIALVVTSTENALEESDFEKQEEAYEAERASLPGNKIVRIIDDFLNKEECDYVIQLAEGHFGRSKVLTDSDTEHYSRTSYSASLRYPEDAMLNSIRAKAAKLIGMPEPNFESFQVVAYAIGQEFQNHFDTFSEDLPVGKEHLARDGQRKYTMLVYLNDSFEGGATHFPNLDRIVYPKQGRVLIFDNLDEQGKVVEASLHAGLPVFKGKKYAMNIWVRTGAYVG
ncbi:MAG: 2OG-Fe(II) oxygenase [Bacteroidota bacterium]